ncbi:MULTISPECIES: Bug family tripartite tricarboxylate transporter substrate binding protein [Cupriavidus]
MHHGSHAAKRRTVLLCLLTGLLAPLGSAFADSYPSRPVSVVVPFPPGGQTDVVGRLIANQLGKVFGQSFVVENRPGVNGSLGSDMVARAAPDGYTLVIGGPGTHAINQLVNANVRYDARKDFTHIAMLSRAPMLLVAAPQLKANTVAELVALAKAHPNSLNVALTGIGSSSHVTTELFKQTVGISLNSVPYKGDVPAMTDLIGGQLDLLFVPATAAVTFVQGGKLKALAVAGSQRLEALPNTPTMPEAGQPRIVNYSWTSLEGPAGMPPEIVQRLNKACQEILKQPDVVAQLAKINSVSTPGTPEQAASFISAEVARWVPVVKSANIRTN